MALPGVKEVVQVLEDESANFLIQVLLQREAFLVVVRLIGTEHAPDTVPDRFVVSAYAYVRLTIAILKLDFDDLIDKDSAVSNLSQEEGTDPVAKCFVGRGTVVLTNTSGNVIVKELLILGDEEVRIIGDHLGHECVVGEE